MAEASSSRPRGAGVRRPRRARARRRDAEGDRAPHRASRGLAVAASSWTASPAPIEQAEGFAAILGDEPLQAAIQIEVPTDVVLARILGRRVCPVCGTTTSAPREVVSVPCPRGDGWAVRRKDDTEAAVRRRLALYDEESGPLVRWFADRGLARHGRRRGEPRRGLRGDPRRAPPRALGRRSRCRVAAPQAAPAAPDCSTIGSSRPAASGRRYLTTMFSIPGSGSGSFGSIAFEGVHDEL